MCLFFNTLLTVTLELNDVFCFVLASLILLIKVTLVHMTRFVAYPLMPLTLYLLNTVLIVIFYWPIWTIIFTYMIKQSDFSSFIDLQNMICKLWNTVMVNIDQQDYIYVLILNKGVCVCLFWQECWRSGLLLHTSCTCRTTGVLGSKVSSSSSLLVSSSQFWLWLLSSPS